MDMWVTGVGQERSFSTADEKCWRVHRVFAGALLVGLTGCARPASEVPAWPQQPSPSYPEPAADSAEPAIEATHELPAEKKSKASSAPPQGGALAKKYHGAKAQQTLEGKATYYADSLAGNRTASGEVYDPTKFTGAHKKLSFGTVVRVVRTDTKSETYVRINDRGPFGSAERIIDLSRAAAEELDMMRAGVVPVRVEIVEQPAD